jgi:hypothetical protein
MPRTTPAPPLTLSFRALASRAAQDYPVPALNIVVHTSKLVKAGLITAGERAAIDEVYKSNPLLCDFVLKRALRSKKGGRLSDCIFTNNGALGVAALRSEAGVDVK